MMPSGEQRILYISGTLPNRSETFVYREIFAMRALGVDVLTASVHEPGIGLGNAMLDRLSASTIRIYSAGPARLVLDAAAAALRDPIAACSTLAMAIKDAATATDIEGVGRLKVLVQATAGIALAHRIRRLGITHIHAHMAHVPTTIAMYAARQLGITFSFTGHANDLFPNRSLLAEKLRRSAFTACISRWHREFYKAISPRDDAEYPVIRCGVDTASVPVAPTRHSPGLRILSVGRLVPKKGFDILLDAVGLIAQKGDIDISVTIAGGGPEEGRLKAQAAGLPPSAHVTFCGETDNDRVMELMGQCELFVLPLRVTASGDRDGIPVVLIEAMAKGRCVVSGDLITIRELIDHGRSGFLVPTEDAGALACVLEQVAMQPATIEEMGRAARAKIESEFDTTANAKALLEAMRRAMRIAVDDP
jgi:glycosyltransferase involved in cell wall biosynthesis